MELAHLPYKKWSFEDYVGLRGLKRLGKRKSKVTYRIRGGLNAMRSEEHSASGRSPVLEHLPIPQKLVPNFIDVTAHSILKQIPIH